MHPAVPGLRTYPVIREQGNGNVTVTTVQGGELTVKADANGVTVTDANGNVANVTAADLMSSNGVVHAVDRVLLPQGDFWHRGSRGWLRLPLFSCIGFRAH